MTDILDRVLKSALEAPPPSPEVEEALKKLAEAEENMTGKDRLEQKRYNLYGTANPDPETRERIDQYMERYYGV